MKFCQVTLEAIQTAIIYTPNIPSDIQANSLVYKLTGH